MLTIGLLWHSLSSSNLGVGALTLSQIALIESAAARVGKQVQFKVFGTIGVENYGTTPSVISVLGLERNFIAPWKSPYFKQVRECDLVLDIGEGDSFTDIYGLERYFILVGTKYAAWLSGIPLILSPQTIGPFNGVGTRAGAKFIMRRSKRVFARDHLSMAYLQTNGITNADEVIDVAFALPFEKQTPPSKGKTRVGINVSGLLYHGGYTRNNQFGLSLDYAALTHAMLDWFTAKADCEVHLVAHVVPESMPVEDDYQISLALQKRYPTVHVAKRFASPSSAKSFISSMDFFVGARMHACIGAFSSGVPVVPLAYSRKFNGLFESLNYSHFSDCKKDSLEQALAKVQTCFDNRQALQAEVAAGNQIAKTKLAKYESYLAEVLKDLHG
jgi:polysaccharide pyruvyl transferase WcaK-like protein